MKKLLPLLLLFLLAGSAVQASHLMGVDIRLNCINSCTTQAEFRVYRDCSGITPGNPVLNFSTTQPGCPAISASSWTAFNVVEVTPICATGVSKCTNPAGVINGVEEYTALDSIITCAAGGCTYDFDWSTCCRNPVITSLSNPASSSMSIANTHTFGTTCNSSPTYKNIPVFYVCQGQSSAVDMGAVDADGNELRYFTTACLDNSSTAVTYAAGYSQNQPFGPSWAFNVDSTSGVMQLTPQPGNIETGVICIETREYDNGNLIGTNVRDIQVSVQNCGTQASPTVGAPFNIGTGGVLSNDTIYFCNGNNVQFDITASDPNPGQDVTLFWIPSLSGATFGDPNPVLQNDTLVGAAPTGQFVWPNAPAGVYNVALSLRDNGCPIKIFNDQEVVLVIGSNPVGPLISATQTSLDTCHADSSILSVNPAFSNITWSTGATTPSIIVTTPGWYHVAVSTPCGPVTDSIEITAMANFDLSGTITTNNPNVPLANQPVYMIWYDPANASLSLLNTTTTDSAGNYGFCTIPEDTVYVKAAPQIADYPMQLPTYYDFQLFWNNATEILATSAPATASFRTRAGVNPGGPGFVGGLISQGANKTDGVGDPVEDVPVFLQDASTGQYLGHTTTNADGYFSFAALPVADYKVFVDVPGVDTVLVPNVDLTTGPTSRDSLDFRLHSTYLELFLATDVAPGLPASTVRILPNPGRSQTIDLRLPESAPVSYRLVNVQGQAVAPAMAPLTMASGRHRIALPELPAGIYFLDVQIGEQSFIQKIIRMD